MRRIAGLAMAISCAGVSLVGCDTSAGSLPRACAVFDRGYARWQAVVAELPQPPRANPRLAAADASLLIALDQATSEAGGTSLAAALQAVAAGVRQLDGAVDNHHTHVAARASRAITLAVGEVRKSCPRI
jgi:hypothetical protein